MLSVLTDAGEATTIDVPLYGAALSPDRTHIAYVEHEVGSDVPSTSRLRVAPVAGGPARTVLEIEGEIYPPSWAPDSDQLVFQVRASAGGLAYTPYVEHDALWVARASTLELREIAVEGRDPHWSPDGSRIVYLERAFRREVRSVDPLGNDDVLHADVGDTASGPRWSADGRWISVAEGTEEGPCALVVIDRATGATTVVADHIDSGCGGRNPSRWSPDGRLAYVQSNLIRVFEPSSGSTTTVPAGDVSTSALAWSPDGTRLVYGTRGTQREGQSFHPVEHLVVTDLDGLATKVYTSRDHLHPFDW